MVCHFPRGTSKSNKIEHRLFSFVSHNWRGKPLIDYATIINLIAGTTTSTGLKVYARLDETDLTPKASRSATPSSLKSTSRDTSSRRLELHHPPSHHVSNKVVTANGFG